MGGRRAADAGRWEVSIPTIDVDRVVVRAGRLHWSSLRNLTLKLRHQGYFLTVEEGSGFLSRPFFVEGDANAVREVRDWLRISTAVTGSDL
jgi:hypothetical protein